MTVAQITQLGKKRAVTLPRDFCPGENKVYINKIGNSVVLIPYHDSWKSLFDSLNEFSDDFMAEREQPKEQTREKIF
ncbi:MAG: type II toxin-antitoxin system VapB family antitoxin [Candidatus Aminicenantes bacterium]|nr:type II toxin-antitoxin system VapB family antitoxin [Candidatus Aminicenantes bacterium]